MIPNFRAILPGIVLAWATFAGHLQPVSAQDTASEQAVRAAMVFNFLKFTDFPSGRIPGGSGLRLCVAVRDARQEAALFRLAGRKVGGRELVVSEIPTNGGACHVFYAESRQHWNALEGHQAVRNALTISGYGGFTHDGGMIEIAVQTNGIQFDINLAQASSAGFHFAPQMLRLARQIHE